MSRQAETASGSGSVQLFESLLVGLPTGTPFLFRRGREAVGRELPQQTGCLSAGRGPMRRRQLNAHWYPPATMTVDPSAFSSTLVQRKDGVWVSENAVAVSYPSGGHQSCFELEPTSFWFNHRNRCIVDLVNRIPPEGPIFDIGGGNGFVTAALEAAGFDAALVEPGPQGVANAGERGVGTRILAEAQAARFTPGSIPAVGMFDVLEHIEDDAGMLRWLHQSLSPGGMLYLTVPAHSWLWSNEDVHAGHFRRYTLTGLSGLLAATGFRREFASYFFTPLVLPILVLRALPARRGIRRSTSGERAAGEHSPPGGRVLGVMLGREARHLAGGRPRRTGSSLIVAARKR